MSELLRQDDAESSLSALERLKDPTYLPTRSELVSTFSTYIQKKYGTDVSKYIADMERRLTYPDRFGQKTLTYEFLTQEYVDRFSEYLASRAAELNLNGRKPIVLETGAGLGRLTHFVGSKCANDFNMIATDSGEYSSKIGIQPPFSVDIISYKDALRKYNPDIVITSWMPSGQDWSKDYRNHQSIKEYILIGPPTERCGQAGTWLVSSDGQHGFSRVDLQELGEHQIGFTDDFFDYDSIGQTKWQGDLHPSTTVSFRRKDS